MHAPQGDDGGRMTLPGGHSVSSRVAELAWPRGDLPDSPLFRVPVAPALREFVWHHAARHVLKVRSDGFELFALAPTAGPAGRFLATDGERKFFVRVTRRVGRPALERDVIDYLAAAGLGVNPIVWSTVLESGRLRVDVRPFIEGRHPGPAEADLVKVASALRDVHTKVCAAIRVPTGSGTTPVRGTRGWRPSADAWDGS
jgi:hypothetical protein